MEIELKKSSIVLKDKILGFMFKEVTRFGNSGKVDCPKKFIGKKVYLIIVK